MKPPETGKDHNDGWALIALMVLAIVASPLLRAVPLTAASPTARAVTPTSYTGGSSTITDGLAVYDETIRFTQDDLGTDLDHLAFRCHGGRARILWHIGNLEPTVPGTRLHLTVYYDGERLGSLLRGSTDGIWNDVPADIHAVRDCPSGTHRLKVRIESITGSWGIPHVANAGDTAPWLRVRRGFIVHEIWNEDEAG